MSENAAPARSGGGFFKLLSVVLLPFAIYGGYNMKGFADNVKDEYKSGTKWQDVWKQVKEGKTDLLKEVIKDKPDQSAPMIILLGAKQDAEFRDKLKAEIGRMMASGKMDRLHARTVITELNNMGEATGDAEKSK